jgi:hypothetical protein
VAPSLGRDSAVWLMWRVFWLWYRAPARERRHRQCLARITELERGLFPDLYQPEPRDDWKDVFAPGAVWRVDDASQISRSDWIPAAHSMSAGVSSLSARGLLGSGEMARMAQEQARLATKFDIERMLLYGPTVQDSEAQTEEAA